MSENIREFDSSQEVSERIAEKVVKNVKKFARGCIEPRVVLL